MRRIADRVLVLVDGRIAHDGALATLDDASPGVRSFLEST
jgi:ABC-type branched-subunit amino acid transport system ATPase component